MQRKTYIDGLLLLQAATSLTTIQPPFKKRKIHQNLNIVKFSL